VALSLAVHGAVAVLALLAFGHSRPLARPAAAKLPMIVLGVGLPKPVAVAQAKAAPALRHPRRPVVHSAAPAQPVTMPAEPQTVPQEQAAPVVATAGPAPSETPPAAGEPAGPLPLLYLAEVSRLIRLRLDYPAQARLDRASGVAVVHILLARDGTVLSVELVRGAGHPALDAEAREVVLRIGKFPDLPAYYARGEQRFAIDQPIGFRAS
jgi:protein TonB